MTNNSNKTKRDINDIKPIKHYVTDVKVVGKETITDSKTIGRSLVHRNLSLLVNNKNTKYQDTQTPNLSEFIGQERV